MLEKWRCVEVTTEVIHSPERPSREAVRVRIEGTIETCRECPLFLESDGEYVENDRCLNREEYPILDPKETRDGFPEACPWLTA